jgi:threonine synthase
MIFESTNGKCREASFFEAMMTGLASDGGLYMPVTIPEIDFRQLESDTDPDFNSIAFAMARPFLEGELSDERLIRVIEDAFNFPVKLKQVSDEIHLLELFYGPTLAFKDFGARFMARLFSERATVSGEKVTILVATSGDTGSAVANGFHNVEGVEVCVLYPKGKVSHLQEMQMATLGGNIKAIEVQGVFDDCQRLVKQAIMDKELTEKMQLSSANSINIARLIPQSFYYAYASLLLKQKGLKSPVFSVPSGNYGNLTGGLLAARMGMPHAGFIAATNSNNVIPEYLAGAEYKPRPSVATVSNAMDVGDPSNFSRILHLFKHSADSIRSSIAGYSFSDNETLQAIQKLYRSSGYLMCPHTAIGYLAAQSYKRDKKIDNPVTVLATAHPVKFRDVIEPVIGGEIKVPDRLQSCLEGKKKATGLKPDFKKFKELLTDAL